jgi:hypothetical protein
MTVAVSSCKELTDSNPDLSQSVPTARMLTFPAADMAGCILVAL